MSEVLSLPVGKVHPDPDNPRSNLGDLRELAASITEHGVLEPVLVRDHPSKKGQWLIVAGHRRHAATIKAGVKTIPALTIELDATEAAILGLVENLQREGLPPVDEAHAYQRLVDLGLKQVDIARRVSRTKGHISKRLTLLELPRQALDLVAKGSLHLEDAYQLAATLNTEGIDRETLIETVVSSAKTSSNWNSQKTEVSQAIRDATTAARKEAERKAMVDELTAAGETALTKKGDAKRISSYWGELDLPVAKHRKEPCSRYAVVRGWVNGKDDWTVEWWCAEPARHTEKGNSGLTVKKTDPAKANEKWQREAKAAAEKRQAEEETRHGQYATAVQAIIAHPATPSIPPIDIFHQLARQTIDDLLEYTEEDIVLALKLLGRQIDEEMPADDIGNLGDLIFEQFEANTVATTLAVTLVMAERSRFSWKDETTHPTFQYLLRLGITQQSTITIEEEEAVPAEELEAVPA